MYPRLPSKHFSIAILGYHGKGGPMKVSASNTVPLTSLWLQAGREIGLQETDPNGEHMEGNFWECSNHMKSNLCELSNYTKGIACECCNHMYSNACEWSNHTQK